MRFSVIITSKAKLQLVACASWWSENRNADQAARWLDGFEAAIDSLCDAPESHGPARENDFFDVPFPVRQLLYGIGRKPTHRAVFEIRGDTVYVVAVRHLAQDDLSLEEL